MCTAPADSLLLLHEARAVADILLGDVLRLPVAKALDVGTAEGMDRAVALLAARLRRAVGRADVDAMREAVAVLDVDWRTTTAVQRRRLVAQALEAAGRRTAVIPSRIQAPLGDAAEEVVASTRSHARREQGLTLATRFNAMDRRMAQHIVRTQGNFVRDEYGRRLDAFGEEARRLVAEGLEAGLGRSDIAESLERAARGALIERAPFYWEVVASHFIGQGRSFAQVSSYAEAGIRRYRIEAVLDEHTCLAAETPIITRQGVTPISRLVPGLQVLTHRGRWQPVLATRRLLGRRPARILHTRTTRIHATNNHRFLVCREHLYGWVRADELRPGDVLLRRQGHP
ncbi:Hint domain-containing protein [Myxococcus sp. AB036A]|uniref:Hint domain-containing protein n=1 Tax=Myxococcus sp. AB036A TaxID=2562793 RepID=UPI001E45F50A|nr:Hint domain-containing protein [Myxococcus sp. AB036A]